MALSLRPDVVASTQGSPTADDVLKEGHAQDGRDKKEHEDRRRGHKWLVVFSLFRPYPPVTSLLEYCWHLLGIGRHLGNTLRMVSCPAA
jgi:hypothetical protein